MEPQIAVKDETNVSVASHKTSGSRASRSSKASSVDLRRRQAALRASLPFDEEEARLELLLKNLRKKRELAEIEAEQAVLEDCESESAHDENPVLEELDKEDKRECMERFLSSQRADVTPPPKLEAGEPPVTSTQSLGNSPLVDLKEMISSMEKCISLLAQTSMQQGIMNQQMLVSAQLPKADVPIFAGDPLSYPLWKNSFDTMVHAKPLDNAIKLNLLHSYVTSKPKEIVQHYILTGCEDAYDQARDNLARRYGNPSIVSTAFSSKLSSWGRLGNRDAIGLQDFADFLAKVVAAKKSVKSLDILDFPQENAKLVEKLPGHLESRWRDEIDRYKEAHGPQEYPPFTAFVRFVQKAADKANIPELGAVAGEQPQSSNPNQGRHARTFVTDVKSTKPLGKDLSSHHVDEEHERFNSCPYCGGDHLIEICGKFLSVTLEERRAFFFEKKICFGCALTSSHQSKQCQERRSCTVCNGRHLSCFHSSQKPESDVK
ncbi:uncharacterized protein [Diadema antillarum]|uniref:uncharacterized protein n=1 Tax=Diadema antillarum TaxID=105358 RepID=UPI003A8A87D0